MATAAIRFQQSHMNGGRTAEPRRSAVLRLLQAERSDEIFPLLLEEIIAEGNPRALVAEADLETDSVSPTAALNWPQAQLKKFSSSLVIEEHPLIAVLHAMQPRVLRRSSLSTRALYIHPILYSQRNHCWEANRLRTDSCLAMQNFHHEKRVSLEDQVCSTCEIRGYAATVVVELPRNYTEKNIARLAELIDLVNSYRSRLFKMEHHRHRLRDMEITI